MDRLIYTAYSGLRGALAAQSAIANNLANANTVGYRADRVAFETETLKAGDAFQVRSQATMGVKDADMTPGAVIQTGRALDLSVNGNAMIAVQAEDGSEAYTRRGDLTIAPSGMLQTGDGHLVLGDGGPISIPASANVTVTADGTVQMVQPGGVPENMSPKFSRLNPMSGIKRMFGANGWIELGKSLIKVALLGTITWWSVHGMIGSILGLGRGNLAGQLAYSWGLLLHLLLALSLGLGAIALFDVPVQMMRQFSRLKMSQQDLRDEMKESEGSPEKKAAIRQRQRQVAKSGIHRAMREAQFVITNPTHFSVALTYDPTKAPAPIVLARGRGEKALAMRELARDFAVPVLEYPALARSVYFTTRENMMIREELFAAVAAVLAFVLSLKRGEKPKIPKVDVPAGIRFDEFGQPSD